MRRSSSSPEPIRARIRGAGLRATPGRVTVLAELERRSSPISHSELADALVGESLDRVTVWRILVALTEAGLVDRVDHGDRTWRFERRKEAHGSAIHPHFMCVSCKAVECLPETSVRVAPRLARHVTEVQLKGRCADCS